jgi:hypothetical protein
VKWVRVEAVRISVVGEIVDSVEQPGRFAGDQHDCQLRAEAHDFVGRWQRTPCRCSLVLFDLARGRVNPVREIEEPRISYLMVCCPSAPERYRAVSQPAHAEELLRVVGKQALPAGKGADRLQQHHRFGAGGARDHRLICQGNLGPRHKNQRTGSSAIASCSFFGTMPRSERPGEPKVAILSISKRSTWATVRGACGRRSSKWANGSANANGTGRRMRRAALGLRSSRGSP